MNCAWCCFSIEQMTLRLVFIWFGYSRPIVKRLVKDQVWFSMPMVSIISFIDPVGGKPHMLTHLSLWWFLSFSAGFGSSSFESIAADFGGRIGAPPLSHSWLFCKVNVLLHCVLTVCELVLGLLAPGTYGDGEAEVVLTLLSLFILRWRISNYLVRDWWRLERLLK